MCILCPTLNKYLKYECIFTTHIVFVGNEYHSLLIKQYFLWIFTKIIKYFFALNNDFKSWENKKINFVFNINNSFFLNNNYNSGYNLHYTYIVVFLYIHFSTTLWLDSLKLKKKKHYLVGGFLSKLSAVL